MPFSDPMADGPTIQLSSSRAIKQGINLDHIFSICKDLRNTNKHNTCYSYGVLQCCISLWFKKICF